MSHALPLLTADQVSAWARERADVARQHAELTTRLEDLDRKLEAVKLLLPKHEVSSLLNPPMAKSRSQWTLTDYVMEVLETGDRGYSPAEVKAVLIHDPDVGDRVRRSMTIVSNALVRLAAHDRAVKNNGRYYLPATLARIRSGEVAEEIEEKEPESFNRLMHQAMQTFGKPFTAKIAMEVGRDLPAISERLSQQPSRIYSWLSREVHRGNLLRAGEQYRYPVNENGATEAAPDAEEAPTSSNQNRPGFRLVS